LQKGPKRGRNLRNGGSLKTGDSIRIRGEQENYEKERKKPREGRNKRIIDPSAGEDSKVRILSETDSSRLPEKTSRKLLLWGTVWLLFSH